MNDLPSWTDPSEAYAGPVMRDNCHCPHLDSILPTILQVQGCGLFAQTGQQSSMTFPDSSISLIHNLHMKSENPSMPSPSSTTHNSKKTAMTYPWGKEQYKFDVIASGGLSDYYCPLIPPRFTQRFESKYMTRKRTYPSSVDGHESQEDIMKGASSTSLIEIKSRYSDIFQRQEKLLRMKKPLIASTTRSTSSLKSAVTTKTTASMDTDKIDKPTTLSSTRLKSITPITKIIPNPNKKIHSISTTPRQLDTDNDECNNDSNTLQNKHIFLARASIKVESWFQVIQNNRIRFWQSQYVARSLQKNQQIVDRIIRNSLSSSSYPSWTSSSSQQMNHSSFGSTTITGDSCSTHNPITFCPPISCQYCVLQDPTSISSTNHTPHINPYTFYSSDALMQCLECSVIACSPVAIEVAVPFLPQSQQHIRQHFLVSGHSFGITCGPLAGIYCMQCGDFIHHEAFDNEIQRINIQQNTRGVGWNRNRPIIRSFKYMDFIVTPDLLFGSSNDSTVSGSLSSSSSSSVVWRGFRATYPSAQRLELISVAYLTYLRIQIFRGDLNIHHYLTLDGTALNIAPSGKRARTIQKIHAPIGLYNLGNTCFLNCVLQCLIHCDSFQKYFLVDVKHNYLACPHLRKAHSTTNQRASSVCLGCEMDKIVLSVFGGVRGLNVRSILEACVVTSSLPILSTSSSTMLSTDIESNKKGSPLIISDMLSAIRKCRTMSRLQGHMQHDAHEFLQEFLDSLGKDCRLYSKQLNQLRVEASSSTFETALNDDIIHLVDNDVSNDTFGGELRSLIICGKCGYKRVQREPYLNISLSLAKELMLQPGTDNHTTVIGGTSQCKPTLSLLSCLKHFTTPEALVDPVFCEFCGMKTPTLKQHTFAKLSRTLTLHLKRFESQTKKKITEPVTFPMSLNMGSYLPDEVDVIQGDFHSLSDLTRMEPREDGSVTPLVIYDLFATIEHTGSLNQGHYVSNVKINGKWYICNDSFVSHSDETKIMNSENAYILFYTRRNAR